MKISYRVNEETHSLNLDIDPMSTPKFVALACKRHFAKQILNLSSFYYDERGYFREHPEVGPCFPEIEIAVSQELVDALKAADPFLESYSDEQVKELFK